MYESLYQQAIEHLTSMVVNSFEHWFESMLARPWNSMTNVIETSSYVNQFLMPLRRQRLRDS